MREKWVDLFNWLSDMDQEWWPFLFMRPERHERMSSFRVVLLAILYGVFAGAAFDACAALAHKMINPVYALVIAPVAFFFVFRFTFAVAWNKRAAKLKNAARAAWMKPEENEPAE
jgi:ABC-type uncharacterized transport system permease subunit